MIPDLSIAGISLKMEQLADEMVIHFNGNVDMPPTTDATENFLNRAMALHPKRVVLDLAKLNFISSLGLGVLVAFRRGLLRHGGTLAVRGVNDDIYKIFQRCNLHGVFEVPLPS